MEFFGHSQEKRKYMWSAIFLKYVVYEQQGVVFGHCFGRRGHCGGVQMCHMGVLGHMKVVIRQGGGVCVGRLGMKFCFAFNSEYSTLHSFLPQETFLLLPEESFSPICG